MAMTAGNTVKVDRFDGEYFEISHYWLMDVIWEKYNMPLEEFMQSYDRKDSEYIYSLALSSAVDMEMKYDEDYLMIG
jgi:hypothetical protein